MEALEHQSFCITLIQHGLHRIDDAWVLQYEQGGDVAVFTVVTEAPFLVERGLPRHRARLPNAFKEGSAPEESVQWRVLAARRMADYLRNNQTWSHEAIDLSDLESFDGHRPSSVFW
jgi:hypothetical protein